ncbi:N-acetylmuramoyl-L-alanine amidase [Prosthecodimorpha staleyi]|uniref:N-acetylmuramoyl-L-alanine amidase n=1 Tax=Prosthecodimorpha staleyi TaxID=2840188 RepID=A0A947DB32_9HYPH|nr:N-acetylmuramoyl-L-alanine amidase [Prosthecodimorpha staleyi]MBT9292257.1 N-acetylmuramoyl-L-alanine amidase [Prosthecodimorpha staleyi]
MARRIAFWTLLACSGFAMLLAGLAGARAEPSRPLSIVPPAASGSKSGGKPSVAHRAAKPRSGQTAPSRRVAAPAKGPPPQRTDPSTTGAVPPEPALTAGAAGATGATGAALPGRRAGGSPALPLAAVPTRGSIDPLTAIGGAATATLGEPMAYAPATTGNARLDAIATGAGGGRESMSLGVAGRTSAGAPAMAAPAVDAPAAGEPPGDAGGPPAVASHPSIAVDHERTRFTIDLSRPVAIDSFGLADPYRIVIDMPEVRFDLPQEAGRAGGGAIASWRWGLFMAGRSRLVFDANGPLAIERAAIERGENGGPARLVLVLRETSREAFMAAHVRQTRPPALSEGTGVLAKGDREPTRAQKVKPVVVIDAGHGGIDVGTRSPATGTVEKGVVLDIARLLEKKLVSTGRYEVHMTRREDTFVPLGERVRIARQHHADLFLSIHADAEYDRLVRGATVYTLDDRASDSAAAALAAKENASDALAGVVPDEAPSAVADILIDLILRETKRFSHVLARNLVEDLGAVGRLVKVQPHRSANFRVLKAHDVPSALVELGFLTNKDDEQLLMSADWREKTTSALMSAIDRYFQNRVANAP